MVSCSLIFKTNGPVGIVESLSWRSDPLPPIREDDVDYLRGSFPTLQLTNCPFPQSKPLHVERTDCLCIYNKTQALYCMYRSEARQLPPSLDIQRSGKSSLGINGMIELHMPDQAWPLSFPSVRPSRFKWWTSYHRLQASGSGTIRESGFSFPGPMKEPVYDRYETSYGMARIPMELPETCIQYIVHMYAVWS